MWIKMKFIKVVLMVVAVSLLWLSPAAAQEASPVDKTSDLAAALDDLAALQGFSSLFTQEISYADGGGRTYQGELAVLRPGKFRWKYTKPYEQLYVSNGQGIWLYEPDLMQVQRLQDLGEVDPVVIQLLDGRVSLDDVLVLAKEDLADGVSSWLVRVGQPGNSVEIWLGIKEKALLWVESKDVLHNKNRLRLLLMHKTVPPANIFEFVVPKGVDVIGGIDEEKSGSSLGEYE